MTDDKDLQQLARAYAEQCIPLSDPDLSKADRDDMVDTVADYAEETLRWLTKTHCIVEKDKVIADYADAKAKRDLYMSATCINRMESRAIDHSNGRMYELNTLFGKSTFEERSEK